MRFTCQIAIFLNSRTLVTVFLRMKFASRFAAFFLLLFIAQLARAAVIRHVLLSDDSIVSSQMQRNCSTFLFEADRHWCGPSLFAYKDEEQFRLDALIKADEKNYAVTNR